MPGAALELAEREEISRALIEDPSASWASIARRVGRRSSAGHWRGFNFGGRQPLGPRRSHQWPTSRPPATDAECAAARSTG